MVPTPWEAAHLAVAIKRHREQMRRSMTPCPNRLAEYQAELRHRASEGTDGQTLANVERVGDPRRMTLLLDTRDVADVMRVSERTVKTLIKSGELPSVQIGTARRVHVDDLDAYLHRLRNAGRDRQGAVA